MIIDLIVLIAIVAAVGVLVWWLGTLPMAAPFKNAIYAIAAIGCILILIMLLTGGVSLHGSGGRLFR